MYISIRIFYTSVSGMRLSDALTTSKLSGTYTKLFYTNVRTQRGHLNY